MKNKQEKNSKIKFQLRAKSNDGVKFVIWRLSQEQFEFITNLGYDVEPHLYSIKTQKFNQIVRKNYAIAIIKDLHYASLNGKSNIVRKLKKSDLTILNDLGIRYRIAKYKIYLK